MLGTGVSFCREGTRHRTHLPRSSTDRYRPNTPYILQTRTTCQGLAGCGHPKEQQSERFQRVHTPAALTRRRFAGPAAAGNLAGGSLAGDSLAEAAPGTLLGMQFEVAAQSNSSQCHSPITTIGKPDLPGGSSLLAGRAGVLLNKGELSKRSEYSIQHAKVRWYTSIPQDSTVHPSAVSRRRQRFDELVLTYLAEGSSPAAAAGACQSSSR